ncbi:hypothetical protein IMCC3088_815 [Aequoribacter fuscus]|uniref:Uncharacterized protein n=1 Tax=Aequoribacter fuscus TaxID=2518989 RepID=F3L099_9GAMM|nr:response regulator [Aequoribacter fuscus]EGG30209.1 hypothetical protein IMCC3088_815 [Aequoribacter fuscus]QHJ86935.1 response regulator [Aequoribacter fuscus]
MSHAITEPFGLLIVDDDESLRLSLLRWAQSVGLQAMAFESAEACLQAWRDHQFELESSVSDGFKVTHAILDITLPGMSGLELAGHLSPPLPIDRTIMITARASEFPVESRQFHRGRPTLSKPFSLSALESMIGSDVNDHSDDC